MTAPETVVRYYNFDIVFAEIPGETTLAINIANCPNRCPGCHSPHLQADAGHVLDAAELRALLERYGRSVTCVCFMGGDAAPHRIARLAEVVRQELPVLHVGWYSGRQELPEGFAPQVFDYIKLGGWVAGAADFADDQSAALQNRSCGRNGRHYGAIPSQTVNGTAFCSGEPEHRRLVKRCLPYNDLPPVPGTKPPTAGADRNSGRKIGASVYERRISVIGRVCTIRDSETVDGTRVYLVTWIVRRYSVGDMPVCRRKKRLSEDWLAKPARRATAFMSSLASRSRVLISITT